MTYRHFTVKQTNLELIEYTLELYCDWKEVPTYNIGSLIRENFWKSRILCITDFCSTTRQREFVIYSCVRIRAKLVAFEYECGSNIAVESCWLWFSVCLELFVQYCDFTVLNCVLYLHVQILCMNMYRHTK